MKYQYRQRAIFQCGKDGKYVDCWPVIVVDFKQENDHWLYKVKEISTGNIINQWWPEERLRPDPTWNK